LNPEISNTLEVLEPATETELAERLARANADGLAVLPRGGGTKSDWGNSPERADLVLSTRRLERVLEHAAGDMTVTVEAGCTIAKLQETLAKQGQRLAIDPLWPEQATVGGVLATNDSGSLRHAFGSLRDLIIGVTVALPDGTLARSGGKVVKNVAGYDLPKLMVGALGTLGVITQATFRLHPLPQVSRTLAFWVPMESLEAFLLSMNEVAPLITGLQIEPTRAGQYLTSVRIEGSPTAVAAKGERVAQAAQSADAEPEEPPVDVWSAPQRLLDRARPAVVCRVLVLPSQIVDLDGLLLPLAGAATSRQHVMQAIGTGLLRLEYASPHSLPEALEQLRRALQQSGGNLVLLRCPDDLRGHMDAWGNAGDALPLMKRLKEQFDPSRTLNPGRFVGGI
jgi:glycolate oxidase FAD binding subunit